MCAINYLFCSNFINSLIFCQVRTVMSTKSTYYINPQITESWCQHFKLFMTKIICKMSKKFSFFSKTFSLMQNHGLWRTVTKCALRYQKYTKIYSTNLPNQPKHLGKKTLTGCFGSFVKWLCNVLLILLILCKKACKVLWTDR